MLSDLGQYPDKAITIDELVHALCPDPPFTLTGYERTLMELRVEIQRTRRSWKLQRAANELVQRGWLEGQRVDGELHYCLTDRALSQLPMDVEQVCDFPYVLNNALPSGQAGGHSSCTT